MQHISGENLDEYLKRVGKVDLDSVLHIVFQLLDALDFVHKKDIVHRDIKPSNIMILPSGHCYLIDFSIGFKIDGGVGMTRATQIGDHLGSIAYMSPEQSKDMKSIDARSDLFSLTKVVCELLTGKPEVSELSKLKTQLNPAIIKVFTKGGEFEVEERYINAADYLKELKQASSNIRQFMDAPSKAICNSTECPDANWGEYGYYKGPSILEESVDAFCTSCGNNLIYKCSGCAYPIDNTRYCGGCGTEKFLVPECKRCSSYLKKEDMNKDTSKLGCTKCRRKAEEEKAQLAVTKASSFDDDIPF